MGQLSGSVGRFFRGIIRIISFGFIQMAEPLEKSPEMIGMRYEEVIAEKAKTAKALKNSIGNIIGEEEILRSRAETILKEIEALKEEKEGAEVLARERLEGLVSGGMSQEKALTDEELVSYQSAFNDASSTLQAKKENLDDLQARADGLKQSSANYTLQAEELAREVDRLRSKRHEAEADARLSQQFDSINESLAGISTSGADYKLANLERDVAQMRGRAKASAKIANVDVSAQRNKLRAAARSKVSSAEFLKAIGAKTNVLQPAVSEKPSEEKPQTAAQEKPQLTE